jgi:hypothetical protein
MAQSQCIFLMAVPEPAKVQICRIAQTGFHLPALPWSNGESALPLPCMPETGSWPAVSLPVVVWGFCSPQMALLAALTTLLTVSMVVW